MGSERWAAGPTIDNPGRPSRAAVWTLRRVVRPVVGIAHRATLEGLEHLPTAGPFVLVANHSAGLGIAEILSFAALWVDRFGGDRPLAGFTHPLSFKLWPLSAVMRALGAIPSTYAAAEAALAAGVPILAFPGGDHETMRPVWQADRVDFGGRLGFLKMARRAGVPVVPMGIRGSHYTAPMLWRSTRVLPLALVAPRLLGVRRWALSLLGVLGAGAIVAAVPLGLPWRLALAWAWVGSPLSYVPWVPSTIRMRIGAPIAPEALFPEPSRDDDLPAALARVQAAVQALVTG